MVNFKVEAVYDYNSPEEDDLTFKTGQIITVTEEEGPDWYVGEYVDHVGDHHNGLFPTNFVKKYEPAPPPRPNRASRFKPLEQPQAHVAPPPDEPPEQEQEPEPAPAPVPVEQEAPASPEPQPPPVEFPPATKPQLSPTSPTSAFSAKPPQEAPASGKASPAPSGGKKPPPPPVAAKSSNFRDRIAAFNSPAAAPLQPFKPGGGPPSNFIKKPFVAPPPSRNAFVAPPREAPPVKTPYRREDLPEIAERQAQDLKNAERAGLTAASSNDGDAEDQPKPTTLRERIALLQKQQAEQAERAAGIQKEKPKKPPVKKRIESHDARPNEVEDPALEKVTTSESGRVSLDNARPPRSSHGIKSPDGVPLHREFLSDANDADQSGAGDTEDAEGTSNSVEEEDVQAEKAVVAPPVEPDVGDEEGAAEEEEEEDEMDAETRRKLELRERMAKMSGGMGMAGMFGGPRGMPPPPPKKKPLGLEKRNTDQSDDHPQQRIAMLPMPGMPTVKSPDSEDTQLGEEREDMTPYPHTSPSHQVEDESDTEDTKPQSIKRTPTFDQPSTFPQEKRPVPPPIPTADRPAPPPLPSASRPVPPPQVRSPSPGSESGDEMTDSAPPHIITSPRSPPAINTRRSSYIGLEPISPTSPDRRMPPMPPMPQIPLASPTFSPTLASRPPPPPPPSGVPPFRQGTMDSISKRIDRNEGETDYEGDYDTDIASGATHKDALKSHARDPSFDGSTIADEPSSGRSPTTPHGVPPQTPSLQRAIPPPPPQQPPGRVSVDAPRAMPPLLPTSPLSRNFRTENDDDGEYDPYNYVGGVPPPPRAIPPPPQSQPSLLQNRPPPPPPPLPSMAPPMPSLRAVESSDNDDDDDLYSAPPARKSHDRPPPPPPMQMRVVPPPPPQERGPPPPPPQKYMGPRPPPPESSQSYQPPVARKSHDVTRALQSTRLSADQPRPSASVEFIASDIDLGHSSHWWTQPNMPPPSLQNRKDILLEMHEAREGNTIEKSIKVLYMDYSQTIITARFEANNVSDVELKQLQQPPPNKLRQDQLEAAHVQFGLRIAKDVEAKGFKTEKALGDGTPQGLITFLLSSHPTALKPVSTRAFGSLVYANLANASTQQYDEIRPGDIISFRNASFKGKHGTIHKSYSMDVGRPDHVGIVVEWDGSKKKVRVWEQGREGMSKKVKEVSWRMGDLRSGEVRVWRVMSRSWVGW